MLRNYNSNVCRLRCGTPMNLAGGGFVLHTFMAEQNVVEHDLCTSSLPSSSDFRGQGGNLISASYSRIRTEGGGELYQGHKVNSPTYIESCS